MSVESEIENLRDDFRAMRAAFDSFTKTFQGDVMSRLATLEQWKVSHEAEDKRIEAKADTTALMVVGLKAQNDRQEGSISALKLFGSLIGGMLVLAEIVHTIIAITKGH